MACVAVLVQALGIRFQLRSQRSASQGINRSWVGAVIKEVVEWSFHSTSIHGWSRLRLCRVLSSETPKWQGRGQFTRHSPVRGIVAQGVGMDGLRNAGPEGGHATGMPDDLVRDGLIGA